MGGKEEGEMLFGTVFYSLVCGIFCIEYLLSWKGPIRIKFWSLGFSALRNEVKDMWWQFFPLLVMLSGGYWENRKGCAGSPVLLVCVPVYTHCCEPL